MVIMWVISKGCAATGVEVESVGGFATSPPISPHLPGKDMRVGAARSGRSRGASDEDTRLSVTAGDFRNAAFEVKINNMWT